MGSTWTLFLRKVLSNSMRYLASESDCPCVSVIVPMYNLGSYACSCIRSLLVQTYANLEIIIVDDGSTDDTVELIESVVEADSRVKILHKINGGLSSARNFGVKHCTGEYIMFVDGDDVLDIRTIELLVEIALENDVSLVTCKYKKISCTEDFKGGQLGPVEVVSGDRLLESLLLLDGESGSACAKLYAKKLLPLLVFPDGQLFEDFGVEATVFSTIDKACIFDAELYGYLAREGSITTIKSYGDAQLDGMSASLDVVRRVVREKPEFFDAFACFEAFCSLRIASRLDLSKCSDIESAKAFIFKARKQCWTVAASTLVDRTWRLRCLLFAVSPALHSFAYSFYGKLTGKVIGK